MDVSVSTALKRTSWAYRASQVVLKALCVHDWLYKITPKLHLECSKCKKETKGFIVSTPVSFQIDS